MTPEQVQAFKVVVEGQVKSALTSLDASEHIFALKSVLFALDSRHAEARRKAAEGRGGLWLENCLPIFLPQLGLVCKFCQIPD
jgi:hypothetical protein